VSMKNYMNMSYFTCMSLFVRKLSMEQNGNYVSSPTYSTDSRLEVNVYARCILRCVLCAPEQ
jgi:hypothetical protein